MITKMQEISEKRGAYERKRRKIWLWYKNRGLISFYYKRKKINDREVNPEIKVKFEKEKLNFWRMILNFIKCFLKYF
jgi:hypothetical protein